MGMGSEVSGEGRAAGHELWTGGLQDQAAGISGWEGLAATQPAGCGMQETLAGLADPGNVSGPPAAVVTVNQHTRQKAGMSD